MSILISDLITYFTNINKHQNFGFSSIFSIKIINQKRPIIEIFFFDIIKLLSPLLVTNEMSI
ncbi:hypothetical protein BpHYR1_037983 [Brachionus plicatilis]|uniref:Uncharacterized protein n=1 Tax=Brachionus plicatilis TaxID=10195 RepID=A0A3M7QLY7_BRAPC|nr:hypothetical protein BpHYR1_037983 [Brachionus plicatilis]